MKLVASVDIPCHTCEGTRARHRSGKTSKLRGTHVTSRDCVIISSSGGQFQIGALASRVARHTKVSIGEDIIIPLARTSTCTSTVQVLYKYEAPAVPTR